MENVVVRNDDANQYSWDKIRSTYTDGILSDRLVNYDIGTSTQTSYQAGIRMRMLQTDNQLNGGVKSWDTIESLYGPDGSLATRLTNYDNGVFRYELFENGVRSQSVQYDNPQSLGDGAKSWDSITSYYDPAGDMAARVTVFDNGVIRHEEFEGGVRVRMTMQDNPQDAEGSGAKAWDTIEMFYDPSGQIEARVITYDDGRVRQDTYENGVRATTEIQDDAYQGGTGAYGWTAINMSYDESGVITHKTTLYDDGRVRVDEYEGGVRAHSTIEDRFLFNGGNYAWDEQEFFYNEDGSLAQREITYDDGDAVQQIYADGNLAQRSDYDGDGSQAWLGRTITYNEDGSVALTELYMDQSELPEDFFVNAAMNDVMMFG